MSTESQSGSIIKQNQLFIISICILGLLVIILFFIAWFVFDSSRTTVQTQLADIALASPTVPVSEEDGVLQLSNTDPEVGGIVAKVSKLMLIPKGEITVVTVVDAPLLHQQNPFAFRYIKNDDKLLLHNEGFIVYDPVANKIVDSLRFYQELPQN